MGKTERAAQTDDESVACLCRTERDSGCSSRQREERRVMPPSQPPAITTSEGRLLLSAARKKKRGTGLFLRWGRETERILMLPAAKRGNVETLAEPKRKEGRGEEASFGTTGGTRPSPPHSGRGGGVAPISPLPRTQGGRRYLRGSGRPPRFLGPRGKKEERKPNFKKKEEKGVQGRGALPLYYRRHPSLVLTEKTP